MADVGDVPKRSAADELAAHIEKLVDERIAYWQRMTMTLLEKVRALEAKAPPGPIQCPSSNGYHQCRLEVDHPGDHKGINGKEEWYAWERR